MREAYRWGTHHHNAAGNDGPLLTPHPEYLALGTRIEQRRRAYRALFDDAISDERLAEIRAYPATTTRARHRAIPGAHRNHARPVRHTPSSRQAQEINLSFSPWPKKSL
jgi:hypothetical protein